MQPGKGRAMATQFDSYFFGDGLVDDARKGIAEAVARTRAAGLPVEGYASSPAVPTPLGAPLTPSAAAPAKSTDTEPKKKRA